MGDPRSMSWPDTLNTEISEVKTWDMFMRSSPESPQILNRSNRKQNRLLKMAKTKNQKRNLNLRKNRENQERARNRKNQNRKNQNRKNQNRKNPRNRKNPGNRKNQRKMMIVGLRAVVMKNLNVVQEVVRQMRNQNPKSLDQNLKNLENLRKARNRKMTILARAVIAV